MNTYAKVFVFGFIVAASAWAGYSYLNDRAPRPADGVLVSTPPEFSGLDWHPEYRPFTDGSQIVPMGWMDVTGRVLAIKKYGGHDVGVRLDLVLGWGKLSDNRVLDHLEIRQSDHDYQIIPDSAAPVSLAEAYASSTNLSLVQVSVPYGFFDALYSIKEGDVVRIFGFRMKVKDANGTVSTGGTPGNTTHIQSVAILEPLRLQINDVKMFGNWEADSPPH